MPYLIAAKMRKKQKKGFQFLIICHFKNNWPEFKNEFPD